MTEKTIFDYTLELECNTHNNESHLEEFLRQYDLSLDDIGEYIEEPLTSEKFQDTYVTRFYDDGSVNFELVLCANEGEGLKPFKRAVREFYSKLKWRFDENVGAHISIKRSKFNGQRLYDHERAILLTYSLLEMLVLAYNPFLDKEKEKELGDKKHFFNHQALIHRNSRFARVSLPLRNTANFKRKYNEDSEYTAILMNKEVHGEKFIEFRLANPKKLMFLTFYLQKIPNWFNTCDPSELKKVEYHLRGVNFDVSDPHRVIDNYNVVELLNADLEISKLLRFLKADRLTTTYKKYGHIMSRDLIKTIYKTRSSWSQDDENRIFMHFSTLENSTVALTPLYSKSFTIEDYNTELGHYVNTKFKFFGRTEKRDEAVRCQILANLLKDFLENYDNSSENLTADFDSFSGWNYISEKMRENSSYPRVRRNLFDELLNLYADTPKSQIYQTKGANY